MPEEARSLLRFSLQLIWAGTVSVAVACYFFRTELMLALYPNNGSAYYGEVLGFVILTLVPFSGIFIYSTLLTANDSLRKMNWLFLTGIVVNIVLNLLLIPSHKAVGAGMSAFFTQATVLAGMMWLAKKELALPFEWPQFLKIAGFAVLMWLAGWWWHDGLAAGWLLKFGGSVTTGLLLAFVLRLVHVRALLGLLKR